MSMVSNEVNWRAVFQNNAAELKVTNTPDGATEQPVVQSDASKLKVTATLDGAGTLPVAPPANIRGIWPAVNATRVHARNYVGGQGVEIVMTVPAGKLLFISSALLTSVTSEGAVCQAYGYVRDTNDAQAYIFLLMHWILQDQKSLTMNYFPALEVSAGWDVCVEATHFSQGCWLLINGWLENA